MLPRLQGYYKLTVTNQCSSPVEKEFPLVVQRYPPSFSSFFPFSHQRLLLRTWSLVSICVRFFLGTPLLRIQSDRTSWRLCLLSWGDVLHARVLLHSVILQHLNNRSQEHFPNLHGYVTELWGTNGGQGSRGKSFRQTFAVAWTPASCRKSDTEKLFFYLRLNHEYVHLPARRGRVKAFSDIAESISKRQLRFISFLENHT